VIACPTHRDIERGKKGTFWGRIGEIHDEGTFVVPAVKDERNRGGDGVTHDCRREKG